MRKGYFGDAGHQIHYRESGNPKGTPLICLPPAPHSGLYFSNFQEALGDQNSLAVDYPGYGGSDPQDGQTIEFYAESLLDLIKSLETVHLLGFHSGCLVALELARIAPQLLDKIVLIDVPYFDYATRQKYATHFAPDLPLPETAIDLGDHFSAQVTQRKEALGFTRAYNLWVETLRAGDRRNHMFQAAFAYDIAKTLRSLDKPAQFIATQSSLLDQTRDAAKICKTATLTERLDIDQAVFDRFAVTIAADVSRVFKL